MAKPDGMVQSIKDGASTPESEMFIMRCTPLLAVSFYYRKNNVKCQIGFELRGMILPEWRHSALRDFHRAGRSCSRQMEINR